MIKDILKYNFIMPPTSKKLKGRIGLALSVCPECPVRE